ncbi:hypothetical protein 2 [Sanxia water strider virus 10]|uniref:hypothetical protein 2 n=1 Tax=Sanxia water strider virus 10 TaxID=1923394 RepID=UPI00090A5657|nr:hypothetical protein 2 [Sanxia water strider virus 10]APG75875.1 hypothetical protein 2 [Sanxia water strider virus 10]APG75883.1 hypothetical protein 2 [Sanxia water strider virus 10]
MQELLSGKEVADDIHVFVKQEPHKRAKLDEGRYRLISAVSAVDTMVDRILFGPLQAKVLETVGQTPTMIGWTPLQGGYRHFRRMLAKRVMCADKSSWDWTVPGWLVDFWEDFVLSLCVDAPEWWQRLVRMRFRMLFSEAVFQFADGTRVKQPVKGVMKSGCLLTILLNSISQVIIHVIVQLLLGNDPMEGLPYNIGDDTTQAFLEYFREYFAEIEKLGIRVKEVKIQDWVEFAGFYIGCSETWPVYWEKHLYSVAHQEDKLLPQTLFMYQMLYAAQPSMLSFIRKHLKELDPTLCKPLWVLRGYVDGTLPLHITSNWI